MTTRPPVSATTRAVRAAIASDREHGAVVPPIHLSATFAFEGFAKPRRFDYTRSGNPTRSHLAGALADLEGGASAVVTSTGMSAVTLIAQLVNPGETIIAAHDCYGGTQRLFRALSQRKRCDVQFVDLTGDDGIRAIALSPPKVVWIETPSNPLLRITDVRRVADAAHAAGALVVVDNTFLSPVLQQPIALGADLVVHSTTKYLNGHSDVVGGAVVAADAKLGEELAWWANCLGITGAPFDSYLTLRGVRTLHSRIRDHVENAEHVVNALRSHPAVSRVYYPGLRDHPGHDIARSQQSGFGAMVSFELADGAGAVEPFAAALQCFTLAESLGGVESLVAHPATMTHASMDADARRTAGISDALVRLSVGIESADDLVNDLVHALDRVRPKDAPVSRRAVNSSRNAPLDVVLLGAGAIGREVIAQISARGADSTVRVAGVIDRSGYVANPDGLATQALNEIANAKRARRQLATLDGAHHASSRASVDAILRLGFARPVLVDVTASDTTEAIHAAITRGCDVVLANKIPLAGSQADADRLHDVAERERRTILHEATVGAGLPVIDTLRKLIDAGDEVRSIEGCPSGTLGFLFGELSKGSSFSDALAYAVARGYTEPDPRIDLSGVDVARKALILARDIGFRGELDDVAVESLVPEEWNALSASDFLARAHELDDAWRVRVKRVLDAGKVLRYRARVTPTSIVVGIVEVALKSSLASLDGTDNQFTFATTRYCDQPLVITGPGAGPAVTASGVVNDLLWIARGTQRDGRYEQRLGSSRSVRGSLAFA